jgi:hypothetical protein
MLRHSPFWSLLLTVVVLMTTGDLTLTAAAAPAPPNGSIGPADHIVGNAFTYQGVLKRSGAPVNGACNMIFRLFDELSAGNPVSSALELIVAVTGGLFAASLDFGSHAFNGQARFLDVQVQCPAGVGGFTPLLPRTELTAAPYALSLQPGAVISGTVFTGLRVIAQADIGVGISGEGGDKGVEGYADGPGGTGVAGYGQSSNSVGVSGASSTGTGVYGLADNGTGVRARSLSGTGLFVEGSAAQSRQSGGIAKALVLVASGAINLCYNSQTTPPNGVTPCGFVITNTIAGDHTLNFGFKVDDRFIVVSPWYASDSNVIVPQIRDRTGNTVRIKTYKLDGNLEDSAFYLVIY